MLLGEEEAGAFGGCRTACNTHALPSKVTKIAEKSSSERGGVHNRAGGPDGGLFSSCFADEVGAFGVTCCRCRFERGDAIIICLVDFDAASC